MDSKLRLQVIACVSVIVCMVLGLVLLVNQKDGGNKQKQPAETMQTQPENNIEQPISAFDEKYELDP